jgi:arginyl-tRNA synthetase
MVHYMQKAAKLLAATLPEFTAEQIFALLERPKTEEHGDIAFPCFQVAKQRRIAPPALAQSLAADLKAESDFESIKAVGPYLNFRLSSAAAFRIAGEVNARGANYGRSETGRGQKVLIEYSSPNVAKELHIGHFRNTILGQSLNNIYRATGHTTISLNHLGDWGQQFGKVAYGYLQWGNEPEMLKNPLEYLMKLYVRFNQELETNPELDREARLLFKKIEEKDPDLTRLWEQFCSLSIEGLKKVYSRLGVSFDHYIGESFYVDKIDSLLDSLREKNLLELSDGAQVVKFGEDEPPCLILTSDGTSLYATRDIAAAIWRREHFNFHRCLYVVGNEQQLHLKQVFAVLAKLGHEWSSSLQHVNYGLYRFKDGKFSTRKGKVVLAEEVMNEARDKALAVIQAKNPNLSNMAEVAETVGVGAVIFNDLSTDRLKDVEFDWERILDFEGDTGPYVQYSYARACSILRQGEKNGLIPVVPEHSVTLSGSEAALSLMKQFGRFEPALEGALRLGKPSIMANYAIDLAKSFNSFYRQVKVLDGSAPAQETREKLGLVKSFRQVLGNTLSLLCMKAPEEM